MIVYRERKRFLLRERRVDTPGGIGGEDQGALDAVVAGPGDLLSRPLSAAGVQRVRRMDLGIEGGDAALEPGDGIEMVQDDVDLELWLNPGDAA
jgi:hypothetical protein